MDLKRAKIAVVGSGAVGSYYGAKLARAGYNVHFLMRSDVHAARQQGLTVLSEGDRFTLPVQAAESPEEIGPVDLVLIALKTTANAALEALLPPLLHDSTILMTMQNGLGNEEYLAGKFGADRVVGALCFVCLNRTAPALIEHYGHGSLSIGEFGRTNLGRPKAIAEAFCQSGIDAIAVENLPLERWRKLVWNIPFNGLSIAAGGATVEDILHTPELLHETRELMAEVISGAAKLSLPIPGEYADFQVSRSWNMGPYKPSSMIDFLAGRAVEVESIWGEPLRRVRQAGLELPRLSLLYALLKRLTHTHAN